MTRIGALQSGHALASMSAHIARMEVRHTHFLIYYPLSPFHLFLAHHRRAASPSSNPPAENTPALRRRSPRSKSRRCRAARATTTTTTTRRTRRSPPYLTASTTRNPRFANIPCLPKCSPRRAAEPPTTIVSLGVGRFAVSRAARYQLALALLFRDELLSADESEPLHAFDPAWSALELRYMRERAGRCAVRPHNEAGRIALPGEGHCLFLVQHCPRALYSNLLEAHWGPESLSRLIVLGNSFAALADNATGGGSGAGIEAWCRVTRAAPLVTEVSISSGRGELDHAFGGTSLIPLTLHVCRQRRMACGRGRLPRRPSRARRACSRTTF